MKKIWTKIEQWYIANAPEIIDTFNPGATEKELNQLAQFVGFELPKHFVESYKIHNGQNTGLIFDSAIIEPESEGFSPIDKIIDTYKLYQEMNKQPIEVNEKDVPAEIRPVFWNDKWLPIMEDGMGNSYFIDMDPTEKGTIGQVIYRDYQRPTYELIAVSMKTWMKEFVLGNLD